VGRTGDPWLDPLADWAYFPALQEFVLRRSAPCPVRIGCVRCCGRWSSPEVMKLVTPADVRELIEQHLPAYCRDKASWRVVAKDLRAAALGADPIGVSVALRMALSLEGVECRRQ
jgi:hypothetical protein